MKEEINTRWAQFIEHKPHIRLLPDSEYSDLKVFIQSETALAVSKERGRVASKIDEVWGLLCQMDTNIKSEKEYAEDIINLINTK